MTPQQQPSCTNPFLGLEMTTSNDGSNSTNAPKICRANIPDISFVTWEEYHSFYEDWESFCDRVDSTLAPIATINKIERVVTKVVWALFFLLLSFLATKVCVQEKYFIIPKKQSTDSFHKWIAENELLKSISKWNFDKTHSLLSAPLLHKQLVTFWTIIWPSVPSPTLDWSFFSCPLLPRSKYTLAEEYDPCASKLPKRTTEKRPFRWSNELSG